MQDRKNILILSFLEPSREPRIHRQIVFLKDRYNITVSGYGQADSCEYTFVRFPKKNINVITKVLYLLLLKAKQYETFVSKSRGVVDCLERLSGFSFDLIIAHDFEVLPLALKLAEIKKTKILLDAHEYAPLRLSNSFSFRFFFRDYFDYLCKKYLPRIDAMTTVSEGISEEYSRNYNANSTVISNASFYERLNPKPVDKHKIRIIHHGGPSPSRKLENMVHLMDLLDDRFYLDLMLIRKNIRYYNKLAKLIEGHPRIYLRDPVPMPLIARTLNEYDIGLYLLNEYSFNARMALPNKLFEFVQGRLAMAIWPTHEMAKIVRQYKLGIVSGEFSIESMARMINRLSADDIMGFKTNSHHAANILAAENNEELFLNIISRLI